MADGFILRVIADSSKGIYDACGHTLVAGGATVSSESPISGLESIFSNYSTAYVNYSSDFRIGSDAFTMSFWLKSSYINDCSAALNSFYTDSSDASQWGIFLKAAGNKIHFVAQNTAMDYAINLEDSVWRHIAVTYDKTTVRIFVNGVNVLSKVISITNLGNNSYNIRIGWVQYDAATRTINGYIFDPCILKGKALWTSNFTVPKTYVYDEYYNKLYYDSYKDNNEYLYGYK